MDVGHFANSTALTAIGGIHDRATLAVARFSRSQLEASYRDSLHDPVRIDVVAISHDPNAKEFRIAGIEDVDGSLDSPRRDYILPPEFHFMQTALHAYLSASDAPRLSDEITIPDEASIADALHALPAASALLAIASQIPLGERYSTRNTTENELAIESNVRVQRSVHRLYEEMVAGRVSAAPETGGYSITTIDGKRIHLSRHPRPRERREHTEADFQVIHGVNPPTILAQDLPKPPYDYRISVFDIIAARERLTRFWATTLTTTVRARSATLAPGEAIMYLADEELGMPNDSWTVKHLGEHITGRERTATSQELAELTQLIDHTRRYYRYDAGRD